MINQFISEIRSAVSLQVQDSSVKWIFRLNGYLVLSRSGFPSSLFNYKLHTSIKNILLKYNIYIFRGSLPNNLGEMTYRGTILYESEICAGRVYKVVSWIGQSSETWAPPWKHPFAHLTHTHRHLLFGMVLRIHSAFSSGKLNKCYRYVRVTAIQTDLPM